jgi:hypothetical protein
MEVAVSVIGSISLVAVVFRETVDVDIEDHAENNEPEGKKLAGKPEVKGKVKEGTQCQKAFPLYIGNQAEQGLKAEGHHPPTEEDKEDNPHLVPHITFLGFKEIDLVKIGVVLHG